MLWYRHHSLWLPQTDDHLHTKHINPVVPHVIIKTGFALCINSDGFIQSITLDLIIYLCYCSNMHIDEVRYPFDQNDNIY
jgi:hypothetical protein